VGLDDQDSGIYSHPVDRETSEAEIHVRKLRTLFLLISVLGLYLRIRAQEAQVSTSTSSESQKLFVVRAEVTGQTFCHVGDESFSTFLNLKLRFFNSSNYPVILSRKVRSPIIRVARDLEAANRRDFLFALYPDFFVAEIPSAPSFGDAPDQSLFAVLAPGETLETTAEATAIGANDPANAGKGGLLAKGSYVFDVGIYTWPYQWPWFREKIDAKELKQRWAKYGDLATEVVYSDFAPFFLPEHFENPRCPLPKPVRHKPR
jgi:hypothetical protein